MSAVDGKLFQIGYSGLTDEDIASFLKRTFSESEKNLANKLIKGVESEFARLCNRNFLINNQATPPAPIEYYEYFNSGFVKVMPENNPIDKMVKIEIDGVDRTSEYIENNNYWVRGYYIQFASPVISANYPEKAVKITYTLKQFWGDDVILMLTKWVAYDFLKSENGGIGLSSMSFAEVGQNFDIKSFKEEKEKVIGRYTDFCV
jgi:hypothetical protein